MIMQMLHCARQLHFARKFASKLKARFWEKEKIKYPFFIHLPRSIGDLYLEGVFFRLGPASSDFPFGRPVSSPA